MYNTLFYAVRMFFFFLLLFNFDFKFFPTESDLSFKYDKYKKWSNEQWVKL